VLDVLVATLAVLLRRRRRRVAKMRPVDRRERRRGVIGVSFVLGGGGAVSVGGRGGGGGLGRAVVLGVGRRLATRVLALQVPRRADRVIVVIVDRHRRLDGAAVRLLDVRQRIVRRRRRRRVARVGRAILDAVRVVVDATQRRQRALGERRRRQLEAACVIEAGRLLQRAVINNAIAEELHISKRTFLFLCKEFLSPVFVIDYLSESNDGF
jgi:hypothetical protein